MGFDDIDRQFKSKEIKLECVICESTKNVAPRLARSVPGTHTLYNGVDSSYSNCLCETCFDQYTIFWDTYWAFIPST